jgi:hypothetical protein
MLNLTDNSNWELIFNEQKLAPSAEFYPYYEPIQDFEVFCDAGAIAVGGYNSNAYYNWSLACWLNVTLPNSPSSSANLQDLQLSRYGVPLNRLAVYEINNLTPPPYTLLFQVPKWHRELYLEVWAYTG